MEKIIIVGNSEQAFASKDLILEKLKNLSKEDIIIINDKEADVVKLNTKKAEIHIGILPTKYSNTSKFHN